MKIHVRIESRGFLVAYIPQMFKYHGTDFYIRSSGIGEISNDFKKLFVRIKFQIPQDLSLSIMANRT